MIAVFLLPEFSGAAHFYSRSLYNIWLSDPACSQVWVAFSSLADDDGHEAHGGRIWNELNPGGGSVLRCRLPSPAARLAV
jgi:hypothetical protein